MTGLQSRNDSFQVGQIVEGLQGFLIGGDDVVYPLEILQLGMLRADAGVIEPGRDGVGVHNLTVVIRHQVGPIAV